MKRLHGYRGKDRIDDCKLNIRLIPGIIPKINAANINDNIPRKLRDPANQHTLRLMNQVENAENVESSDDDVDNADD